MTLAISKAVEEGSEAVVCASTGTRARARRPTRRKAGITCAVLVPKGKVALGKMAATLVHGARVLEVQGNFDASLDVARDLAERYPVTLVNSVNPFRLQGQKTCAFEIVDVARPGARRPLPAGGQRREHLEPLARLLRVPARRRDPRAAAPLRVPGRRRGAARARASRSRTRRRSPRRSGSATPRRGTWRSRRRGTRRAASGRSPTAQILAAYRRVAREGLFAEPASAASVAGLLQAARGGRLPAGRDGRVRPHRPRPQGSGVGDRRRGAAGLGARRRGLGGGRARAGRPIGRRRGPAR